MPNLHELFDAASGDLPPLPDLAPSARRIVRRRQLAARTSAAVLSSALVIGAGTFALAVQNSGNARDAASGPLQAYSRQYVLDTLRSLWPNKDQQLSAMPPGGDGIIVTQDGKQVAYAYFEVMADIRKFPGALNCFNPPNDCFRATTADGDNVLAEHDSFTWGPGPSGGTYAPFPHASASVGTIPTKIVPTIAGSPVRMPVYLFGQASGQAIGYRVHGIYFGQLNITVLSGPEVMTDQQMLGIVESPAYEQLMESAVAASSLSWFGTPPAGIPSDTQSYTGPSASTSGGYSGPPSATTTTVTTLPPPSTGPSASLGGIASSYPSASPSIGITFLPSGGASQAATPTPTQSAK